jgi:hypothetical protein
LSIRVLVIGTTQALAEEGRLTTGKRSGVTFPFVPK